MSHRQNLDFPRLSAWSSTHEALHGCARVMGEIRKHLSEPHPLWWHASLKVDPRGISSAPLETGHGSVEILLDLLDLHLAVRREGQDEHRIAVRPGVSTNELGRMLVDLLTADGGIEALDDAEFEDATLSDLDADAADRFHRALTSIEGVFQIAQQEICGDCSPIQLWPHHFDLSFERFGVPLPNVDTTGSSAPARCQIGFGFSPGDDSHREPYFYVKPWPFQEALVDISLPEGATWYLDEGWQGSLLPYSVIEEAGADRLRDYLLTVYRAASPLLGE